MRSNELEKELEQLLINACLKHLEYMKKDLRNCSIFSYSIYCSSGFRNMGIAACTKEWLLSRKNETHEYPWFYEVNASEWDYINKHYDCFDEVNSYIDKIYTIFYDGYLDDINLDKLSDEELWDFISCFFSNTILAVLKKLINLNVFYNILFEKELLLGVQFSDPDIDHIQSITKISSCLNNDLWHSKIIWNCEQILKLSL